MAFDKIALYAPHVDIDPSDRLSDHTLDFRARTRNQEEDVHARIPESSWEWAQNTVRSVAMGRAQAFVDESVLEASVDPEELELPSSPVAREAIARQLADISDYELHPSVYPADGGVAAMWIDGNWQITVTMFGEHESTHIYAVDVSDRPWKEFETLPPPVDLFIARLMICGHTSLIPTVKWRVERGHSRRFQAGLLGRVRRCPDAPAVRKGRDRWFSAEDPRYRLSTNGR